MKLKLENKRIVVAYGERDGVYIGHVLLAVNGQQLNGDCLPDGKNVLEVKRIFFGLGKPGINLPCCFSTNFHY